MKFASSVALVAIAFAGLAACSDRGSFVSPGILPPPTPSFRATSVDSGGGLKILLTLSNPHTVHLQVADFPSCPFDVTVFPDATGESMVTSGTSLGTSCSSSASTTDLAPGDSLIFIRAFSANELAQFTPGLYGINVTVGTSATGIFTGWGGAVRLPLSSK